MKQYPFRSAEFVKSAAKSPHFPVLKDDAGVVLPEMAAAGRSNVGKSSLINHLLRHRGLAKVSQVPGKTQLLNFFLVDRKLVFTDLPGYGYAKVPVAMRISWGKHIEAYIENRPTLQLVLFLLDMRRTPNEDDRQLLEWLLYHGKKVILVLTKADKLTKNQRPAQIKKILAAFDGQDLPYVSYSSTKNLGRDALLSLINQVLADETVE